jgi:hypothetical protein
MFYEFRQNNSGGSFVGPVLVIVEATSPAEANEIAQEKADVYFDGCARDLDCDCCGDRWYPLWDEAEGSPVPSHYGTPLSENDPAYSVAIYYLDGRVEKINEGVKYP